VAQWGCRHLLAPLVSQLCQLLVEFVARDPRLTDAPVLLTDARIGFNEFVSRQFGDEPALVCRCWHLPPQHAAEDAQKEANQQMLPSLTEQDQGFWI